MSQLYKSQLTKMVVFDGLRIEAYARFYGELCCVVGSSGGVLSL